MNYFETTDSDKSSPITNFYMEKFKSKALETTEHKPKVDDTFQIWLHGEENLNAFLQYLNNNNIIQFTVGKENNSSIAFLDLMVSWIMTQVWDPKVYRKLMHIDQYL